MNLNQGLSDDAGAFTLVGEYSARYPGKPARSLFASHGKLQLDAAPRARARVHEFKLPRLTFGNVLSTGHRIAVTEPNSFSILLPVRGLIQSRTRAGELSGAAGSVLAFPPDWRDTRVAPDARSDFHARVLVIPTDTLLQAANDDGSSVSGAVPGFHARVIGPSASAEAAALVQLAGLLADEISSGARSIRTEDGRKSWEQLLLSKVLDLMLVDQMPTAKLRPRARRMLVDRAMAFIQANYATIHTVSDIAVACQISVRTLETAFEQFTGATPSEVLRNHRLDVARSMIERNLDMSVTEVAFSCGFNHLGRFAGAYKSRFGTSPSSTRRSS